MVCQFVNKLLKKTAVKIDIYMKILKKCVKKTYYYIKC